MADSFGRYGYNAPPGIPDLNVSKTGMWADYRAASHLEFSAPINKFVVKSTHATAQVCLIEGPKGCPKQIRSSLVGNSVDLDFGSGLSLTCRSSAPPFLSWPEGTVGPGVPTPDLKWALLSFSTPEPPYLLGFSGASTSLKITGVAGRWNIEAPQFSGWVRIWLPFGVDPEFGTDAATLGPLSRKVAELSWLWETKTPSVSKVLVSADDLGVDATWKFDGPGAFIPQAPLLAQLGGSALSITTPYRTLDGTGTSGPYCVLDGQDLTIHFPSRRIKFGRAVGIGDSPHDLVAVAPVRDVPKIVELGCESLLALGDDNLVTLADDTITRFLVGASYSLEPNTGQQLPFTPDGEGLELTAAHCFLAQAAMVAESSPQPNALFDSLLWRRDWWTWMIPAKDLNVSRRATALTALAGAMSSEPAGRLYAATLEAGLDAQRGERVWKKRKSLPVPDQDLAEPMLGLREGIYVLNREKDPGIGFFTLLQSPLKVGEGAAIVVDQLKDDLLLRWRADEGRKADLEFFTVQHLEIVLQKNLKSASIRSDASSQVLTFVPLSVGLCSAKITATPPLPPLPVEVAAPAY